MFRLEQKSAIFDYYVICLKNTFHDIFSRQTFWSIEYRDGQN